MLSSFVTGKYTSIWEKVSASETENWDVQYHKSETDCTNLLEAWKSENKVKIGWGPFIHYVSTKGGRGVDQILIFADEGGVGVSGKA